MDYEIAQQTGNPLLKIRLDEDEAVIGKPGTLVYREDCIEVATESSGGGLRGAVKSMVGGGTPMENRFTAEQAGELWLAPNLPGGIEVIDINDGLVVNSESFLGSTPGVEVDVEVDDERRFLVGQHAFTAIELSGDGKAFVSSHGDMESLTVSGDEQLEIGHVVAMDRSVEYDTTSPGDIKTSLLGGEGKYLDFESEGGEVWLQTRSVSDLSDWVESVVEEDPAAQLKDRLN